MLRVFAWLSRTYLDLVNWMKPDPKINEDTIQTLIQEVSVSESYTSLEK